MATRARWMKKKEKKQLECVGIASPFCKSVESEQCNARNNQRTFFKDLYNIKWKKKFQTSRVVIAIPTYIPKNIIIKSVRICETLKMKKKIKIKLGPRCEWLLAGVRSKECGTLTGESGCSDASNVGRRLTVLCTVPTPRSSRSPPIDVRLRWASFTRLHSPSFLPLYHLTRDGAWYRVVSHFIPAFKTLRQFSHDDEPSRILTLRL